MFIIFGVDIKGIDVGVIYVVLKSKIGVIGGGYSLRDEAGRVIGSFWIGGFNEYVVFRGCKVI